MMFLSKAWGYILAALAAAGAIVGIYAKGRQGAKKEAKADALEVQLKQEQKHSENLKTAKDVTDNVNSAASSDVHKRLQDKYSRD